METKDKTELLKFISETHRREFNERRKHEIKIVFAVLTFYVLAAASRFTTEFPANLDNWFEKILWCVFILLAIISSVFLWFVHNANYTNLTIAQRAESAIEKLIKEETAKIDLYKKPFKKQGAPKGISWVWQTLIIVIFACSSAIILTLI